MMQYLAPQINLETNKEKLKFANFNDFDPRRVSVCHASGRSGQISECESYQLLPAPHQQQYATAQHSQDYLTAENLIATGQGVYSEQTKHLMSRRMAKQQATSLDSRQSHEYTRVTDHLAQIKLNLTDQKILKHSR